jgi:type IX secretion system PorP/SprF family membrane protein
MLKKFFLGIILISGLLADAQDAQFSQFYANPLYLNPAFAGSQRCPRVNLNFRNQWPGLPSSEGKTFVTYSASYDQHFDGINGGVGLLVLQDRAGAGTLNTTNVNLMYSYQLQVNRKFTIRAGMQAGYLQKNVDWNNLTFGDQIDPRRGFIYNTNEIPITNGVRTVDFSAGVVGYTDMFYGGFAVHHLTEPNESLTTASPPSPLPKKFTVHGGALIPLGDRNSSFSISPNILYQRQAQFSQINFGVYASKGPFVGGLWLRNKDSFIALVGITYEMLRVGYSYDLTVSQLTNRSGGSHEISLAMQFECKRKSKRYSDNICPTF